MRRLKKALVIMTTAALTITSLPVDALAAPLKNVNAGVYVEDEASTGTKDEIEIIDDESSPVVDADMLGSYGTYFEADPDTSDNDELLAGYLEAQVRKQQYVNGMIDEGETDGTDADDVAVKRADQLGFTGNEKVVYEYLARMIPEIAAGNITDTVLNIPVKELNGGKLSYTASELGLSTLTSGNSITDEASTAFFAKFSSDIKSVVDALLVDYPYDLYWFDKTKGYRYGISGGCSSDGTHIYVSDDASYSISMYVSADYAARTGYVGTTETDRELIEAVNQTIPNAQAIVDAAAAVGSTDYSKLVYYRDWISNNVAYNTDAATGNLSYGNPWQLIYVFDGDSSTNVVCEGYSKAFKLLCDLTQFSHPYTGAYIVSGRMTGGTGAGNHMWNIVRMDDGKYYLVDVTNYDSNSVARSSLFLGSYTGRKELTGTVNYTNGTSVSYPTVQYDYAVDNGGTLTYVYDYETVQLYSDDELTLSSESYSVGQQVDIPQYKVTFITNNGTTIEPEMMSESNSYVLPTDLKRTGYTFKGWYTNASFGESYKCESSIVVSSNITLYASWTPINYMVAFNGNGGTGTMDPMSFAYDESKSLTVNNYNREGYTFAGWNTRANGSGTDHTDAAEVSNLTAVEGAEITLYAQWTPITYYVKYDPNTGSGSMADSDHVYGESSLLSENTFTKEGYSFAGWNTWENGNGDTYKDEAAVRDLVKTAGGSVILYAQWTPITYSVIYDANEGTGTMSASEIRYDETIALRLNGFERDGYKFAGWNTKADGSGTAYADGEEIGNLTAVNGEEITLYAIWEELPDDSGILRVSVVGKTSFEYTGEMINPEISVAFTDKAGNETNLTANDDYTLTITDNTNAGTAHIRVVPKGEYENRADEAAAEFTITPLSLSDPTRVEIKDITLAVKDEVQKGTTKVTYKIGGKIVELVEDKDFTYDHSQVGAGPGEYTVTITGKGNYTGTASFTQKVVEDASVDESDLPSSFQMKNVTVLLPDNTVYEYAGSEIRLEGYSLNLGSNLLKEDRDYTVTYKNNAKAGKATITFTGKGRCSGKVSKTFTISKGNISDIVFAATGAAETADFDYTKGGVKPDVIVRNSAGIELREGTDYSLKYSNNTKSNVAASVKITGKGNYTGGTTLNYNIKPNTITAESADKISAIATDLVFSGKGAKAVTSVTVTDLTTGKKLAANTDYNKSIEYSFVNDTTYRDAKGNSVTVTAGTPISATEKYILDVGTLLKAHITFREPYYSGSADAYYRIVQASMAKASVKANTVFVDEAAAAAGDSSYLDNKIVVTAGGVIIPRIDADGDANFEILNYAYNEKTRKVTFTIHGLGNYGGTKNVTITAAKPGKNHIVTFNPNGATSGKMSDKKMTVGKSYKLTKNGYTRKGYQFAGWSDKPDGEVVFTDGSDYPGGASVVDAELLNTVRVLYARWVIKGYSITYVLGADDVTNDGNLSVYTIEDVAESDLALFAPVREGYTFVGWYTDAKCSVKNAITAIPKGSTSDYVLYAKWKTNMNPADSFTSEVPVPTGDYIDVTDYAVQYSGKTDMEERVDERSSYEFDEIRNAVPDDGKDDYKALRAAVIVAGKLYEDRGSNDLVTVYVPAGTYNIEINDLHPWGLQLEGGVSLVMDNDAILKFTVANGFDQWFYPISIADMHDGHIENVSIRGGQVYGVRDTFKGSNNKYDGHGIGVVGATHVTISDMQIYDNYGDGIYLGTKMENSDFFGCSDIKIKNCDIYGNRRNNISIVDADDLIIDHCNIYNANGAYPECGVIIEPNFESGRSKDDAICKNVTISNCYMAAWDMEVHYYSGAYVTCMSLYTNYNPLDKNYCVVDGLNISGCTFDGYVGIYSGKHVTISNDNVFNGKTYGVD